MVKYIKGLRKRKFLVISFIVKKRFSFKVELKSIKSSIIIV